MPFLEKLTTTGRAPGRGPRTLLLEQFHKKFEFLDQLLKTKNSTFRSSTKETL
jgi:hypothetical protein